MKTLYHYLAVFFLFVLLQVQTLQSQVGAQDSIQSESEPGFTEEIIEIKLSNEQIVDEGKGISQVFLVADDGVIHHAGEAKKIVKPAEVADEELAYLRIYFTGKAGEIENGIIVLIAGHDTNEPRFFVGQNNNLNFTDDGEAMASTRDGNGFVLELVGDDPNSKFSIKLIPFRGDKSLNSSKRNEYLKMFQGFKSYMGGEFADVENWFYNQRLNTRTASVKVAGHKTMIGLHDYDCDGLYFGETDRLLVGKFGAEKISYALADGAINVARNEIFLIENDPYKIIDVASDGSSLRIAKSNAMPDRLFVGSSVPDLKLKSFDGKLIAIKDLIEPGKLLVLDFWGHWCAPCVASIPTTIKFQEKWKEKATFVGVHYGDHDAARELVEQHKIPFTQLETSDEVELAFFIDAWPSYVVIDENGKLVSFRSSLKEIARQLDDY